MNKKHGTGIAWTHWPETRGETWTVIRGCEMAKYKLANGRPKPFKTCVGCYAMVQAASLVTRFDMPQYRGLTKKTSSGPVWNGTVNFDEKKLVWPLHARNPRTFFLTSMGDLYFKGVTPQQRARILAVAVVTPRHRVLVLTKRPNVMANELNDPKFMGLLEHEVSKIAQVSYDRDRLSIEGLPRNIWWGTSIEDNASAEWALGELIHVPAPGRLWTSFEPMIEYVDLKPWLQSAGAHLSWVVLGGASKQRKVNAWPFHLGDAAQVVADCREAGVPLFIKQLGANPTHATAPSGFDVQGQHFTLPNHDNHNANPEHWPSHLRVQQFPVSA